MKLILIGSIFGICIGIYIRFKCFCVFFGVLLKDYINLNHSMYTFVLNDNYVDTFFVDFSVNQKMFISFEFEIHSRINLFVRAF